MAGRSKNRLFSQFIRQLNEDLTVKSEGIAEESRVIASDVLDSAEIVTLIENTSTGLDSADVVDIISNTIEHTQLNQSGTLKITTGTARWYAPKNINISKTTGSVSIAPAGSSLIATLNKNGSTIDTLTIADSSTTDENRGLSLAVNSGDYLTVDITQVGSSTAGSDFNLIVEYTEE